MLRIVIYLFIHLFIHQSTSTIRKLEKTLNVHISAVWTKWPTQGQATYTISHNTKQCNIQQYKLLHVWYHVYLILHVTDIIIFALLLLSQFRSFTSGWNLTCSTTKCFQPYNHCSHCVMGVDGDGLH